MIPVADPNQAKSFRGREAELGAIAQALDASPFVLLHGPAGAGKTRLARRFMAELAGAGALFADLSAARSKADLLGVVAGVVGVALGAEDTEQATEQIGYALEARGPGLIVLDNLEAIEEAAATLRPWLARGPRFIGTSRIRLGLPGEVDVEVGPLELGPARALFCDRARLLAPEFVADAATDALIEKLERIPLAIELAAARAHVLTPEALLERFASHLDLLRSSAVTLPERHRSLRATVDGSWSLCDEPDRRALATASVFRGGFDLPAAEAVVGADAPDRLESLLRSSLVHRVASSAGGTRFALYESVREFASEKLAETPELRRDAELRHASHYRALAERLAERSANAEPRALAIIGADTDNLMSAFLVDARAPLAFNVVFQRALPADLHVSTLIEARARIGADDLVALAGLELALARAVRRAGRTDRALEHAVEGEALALRAGDPLLIADAAYMRGTVLFDAGRPAEGKACAERAIELAESCGAQALMARSFDQLGFCALDLGDFALASRCAERALAIAQANGFGLIESFAENLMGAIHGRRGELASATGHFQRGLVIARGLGYTTQEAILLGNLAKVSVLGGDADQARELLGDALALSRRMGLRRGQAVHLANLALVEADVGRLAEARALAAHAEEVAEEVRSKRPSLQSALLLGSIALEEGRLDEAAANFDRALATAEAIGQAEGKARAMAGRAAARALSGSFREAGALVLAAVGIAGEEGTEVSAIVDARRALVHLCRADAARSAGSTAEARALDAEAAALLQRTESKAASSVEVRLARRLALAQRDRRGAERARQLLDPRVEAAARQELVTRAGVSASETLPGDADLAFDAIERRAVVDGQRSIDLRKKPVAARLLEVVLAEPETSFDKARLYREVWRSEFRSLSQGAALYKATDRLARLLDPDPRRFFRWNEAGCLVIVAKRPALLRLPGKSIDRS